MASITTGFFRYGLSPRGRGNLVQEEQAEDDRGSIPAWAGEPSLAASRVLHRWVYPRVGGGTLVKASLTSLADGLSPRGRGNHDTNKCVPIYPRSIPAWAGEPLRGHQKSHRQRVYPRVGGGTFSSPLAMRCLHGLSPRGRGNRLAGRHQQARAGSIPAWAGEPGGVHCAADLPTMVYPRVGGGTWLSSWATIIWTGLSPRGRGNQRAAYMLTIRIGSIPAWAGEPLRGQWSHSTDTVYPRVGGGTPSSPIPTRLEYRRSQL